MIVQYSKFNNIILLVSALFVLTACSSFEAQNKNTQISSGHTYSTIKPIIKFNEIHQHTEIDESTLLLIDIDNTILTPNSHYGSDDYFSHIVKKELTKAKLTPAEANLKVYDRWVRAQEIITTRLVDEEIHQFIEKTHAKNAVMIAFTARRPIVAEITYNQLKKHKIDFDLLPQFSFKKNYTNQIYPDLKWCEEYPKQCANHNRRHHDCESLYKKGILFAHNLNTKGKVFKDFYRALSQYRKDRNFPPIQKIILVDDRLYNLQSLETATKELNLEFYGYHIQFTVNFDAVKAMNEEKEIFKLK